MGDFDAIESMGEDPAYACCDREIPIDDLESALPSSSPLPHRTRSGVSIARAVVTCDACGADTEIAVGTRLSDVRRLEIDVRTGPVDGLEDAGTEPVIHGDAQPPRDAADAVGDDDATEGAE